MTRVRSTDLDPLTNSVTEEDMNGNQCYYRYDCAYSNIYCDVSLKCHEKVPKADKIIRSATTEIKSIMIFKKHNSYPFRPILSFSSFLRRSLAEDLRLRTTLDLK